VSKFSKAANLFQIPWILHGIKAHKINNKITDFRFIADANRALGPIHGVDVGSVADVSEDLHATPKHQKQCQNPHNLQTQKNN
jgi:hypothetical protein